MTLLTLEGLRIIWERNASGRKDRLRRKAHPSPGRSHPPKKRSPERRRQNRSLNRRMAGRRRLPPRALPADPPWKITSITSPRLKNTSCAGAAADLLLSTLDWALIETWKDAGIPLEAVLRGIDAAFDRYDQRPSKTQEVNSLAYLFAGRAGGGGRHERSCRRGSGRGTRASGKSRAGQGFEPETIAALPASQCRFAGSGDVAAADGLSQACSRSRAKTLRHLAEEMENRPRHGWRIWSAV